MLNFNHFSLRSPIIHSTEEEKDPFLFSVAFKKSNKTWTAQFPFYPSMSLVTVCSYAGSFLLLQNCDSTAMETISFSLQRFPACWGKAYGHNRAEQTARGCQLRSGDCNYALLPVSGQCQENHCHRRLDSAPMKITNTLTPKMFV